MNQCMDFLQIYIDTLFGEGKELLDFGDLDLIFKVRECSGLVVKCLIQDQGVLGSSLTGITALCPWARHINPCFVLHGPTQEDPSRHNWTIVDWDIKNQTKQTHIFKTKIVFPHAITWNNWWISASLWERSGSVVECSRLRGRGFEPHQRHCVVVLEQDNNELIRIGKTCLMTQYRVGEHSFSLKTLL